MPTIKTVDLTKYYVDKKKNVATAVLYNVNCTIPDRSFTVIAGSSGCGKTTFVKTLTGLLKADDGKIYFDKADFTDVSPQKRNVSYLSQEYALYPHLTVFDNVAYPLKIMRAPADEIRMRVNETLEMLDISFLASRKIRQCSGGQLQRAALARALVKNPDVVFLDEPLSNLDEKTRRDVSMQFAKLQKKLSSTFVYVTHSVAEAQRLADYVIVMDNGEVVQEGEAEKVFKDKEGAFSEFVSAERQAFDNERKILERDDDDEIV